MNDVMAEQMKGPFDLVLERKTPRIVCELPA